MTKTPAKIKKRLEYLRREIKAERISYGEIAELQSLAKYIDNGDVELLQWAGVSEEEYNKKRGTKKCPHCTKYPCSEHDGSKYE